MMFNTCLGEFKHLKDYVLFDIFGALKFAIEFNLWDIWKFEN